MQGEIAALAQAHSPSSRNLRQPGGTSQSSPSSAGSRRERTVMPIAAVMRGSWNFGILPDHVRCSNRPTIATDPLRWCIIRCSKFAAERQTSLKRNLLSQIT
ncbi:hypothetical protein HAX54_003811, partial [Datura stramonium]|nr:hypothetical protein [Datura stramonium]